MSESTARHADFAGIPALPVALTVVTALKGWLHSKAVLLHRESLQTVLKGNAQI